MCKIFDGELNVARVKGELGQAHQPLQVFKPPVRQAHLVSERRHVQAPFFLLALDRLFSYMGRNVHIQC